MTNTPGTSTPNYLNAKAAPTEIDQTPRFMVVGPASARGFSGSSNHDQQRYYDIFDDTLNTGIGSDETYQARGLGGVIDDRQSPFPNSFPFASGLDRDTVFFLRHHKGQGFQIVIQAGTRVVIIATVILILLMSSPAIRDTIDSVIKTILNLH